jgi:putative DNA modification/repair radical SAM protein
MDTRRKLTILADAAKYDASCASGGSQRAARRGGVGSSEGTGICHSYTPDGRCVSLLKILFTNYCVYDCRYCVNRLSSDVQRASFTVAEVVSLTLDFYRRNYIEGLFLSSGILKSADYTLEQLCEVARVLRDDHGFGGYIHLKVPAGAASELLARAGRLADRLSVNVELATETALATLAPEKQRSAIERSMAEVKAQRLAAAPDQPFAPAGQSTQLIVGASACSDAQILSASSGLYAKHGLRRVYYSAFSPIPHADARLPLAAPPLAREHRLYEADWLMRFYGFAASELTTEHAPNLDLALDPKLAWALRHRELFPVDLNRAPRELLLRVPGLGLRTVRALLALRRQHAVRAADLRALRVPLRRTLPFVVTADAGQLSARVLDSAQLERWLRPPAQLSLFDPPAGQPAHAANVASASALTGEL